MRWRDIVCPRHGYRARRLRIPTRARIACRQDGPHIPTLAQIADEGGLD